MKSNKNRDKWKRRKRETRLEEFKCADDRE